MRSFKLAIGLPLIKRPSGPASIKTLAGWPLINCSCGAMAGCASESQIWGSALPVGAGFDKLAIAKLAIGLPLIKRPLDGQFIKIKWPFYQGQPSTDQGRPRWPVYQGQL